MRQTSVDGQTCEEALGKVARSLKTRLGKGRLERNGTFQGGTLCKKDIGSRSVIKRMNSSIGTGLKPAGGARGNRKSKETQFTPRYKKGRGEKRQPARILRIAGYACISRSKNEMKVAMRGKKDDQLH